MALSKEELLKLKRIRWLIISTANQAGTLGATELMCKSVIDEGERRYCSQDQIRKAIVYLEGKGVVKVEKNLVEDWVVCLTPYGSDIYEGTTPPPEGIYIPKIF